MINHESNKSSKETTSVWRSIYRPVGIFTVVAAGVFSVAAMEQNRDPQVAFTRNFAADGKCLDGTPFDTDSGSSKANSQINTLLTGEEILTIVPRGANYIEPSVLFLTVGDNGWLQAPTFSPADYTTGEYLYERKCPNLPDGY